MIGAIILAAGESLRMGRPKLSLPWMGGQSMIAHMVEIFSSAGAAPIVVVTGSDKEEIESCLQNVDVIMAHNPNYADGEMLSSTQIGLKEMDQHKVYATLICPGDLPLLKITTVETLIQAWHRDPYPILIPSHSGRRGHPLLVEQKTWSEINAIHPGASMRDFLQEHEALIQHLPVDDLGIRRDIDTPQDYHDAQVE
jgi:molybdenum cofactor cytidylyltransferase